MSLTDLNGPKSQKYREKELNQAMEFIKETLKGDETVQGEIMTSSGIALKSTKDSGIKTLFNITRENKRIKVWARHVKSLALRFFS